MRLPGTEQFPTASPPPSRRERRRCQQCWLRLHVSCWSQEGANDICQQLRLMDIWWIPATLRPKILSSVGGARQQEKTGTARKQILRSCTATALATALRGARSAERRRRRRPAGRDQRRPEQSARASEHSRLCRASSLLSTPHSFPVIMALMTLSPGVPTRLKFPVEARFCRMVFSRRSMSCFRLAT